MTFGDDMLDCLYISDEQVREEGGDPERDFTSVTCSREMFHALIDQAKEANRLRALLVAADKMDHEGQPGDGMFLVLKELGRFE